MARRLALSLAGLLALAACGGSSSKGSTLTATGAIAVTANQFTSVTQSITCPIAGGSIGAAFAAVGASDQSGMCGYFQRGQDKQNAKSIFVVAVNVNPLGAATVTPGTYTITTSPSATQTQYAAVIVSQNDASCSPTDVEATGGTVTITSVSGGRIQGNVNATLSNGGAVNGSFDAPSCAYTLPGDLCSGTLTPPAGTCVP
ncbi:hypothetical protein [Anaeromyxobacter oryzae]|uniref:Lipoprotein n=1 Tax=Anaeromyxobacter oryzae TaxID=2918170 RepID=A0ABM7WNY0_9BACT|nr:hypothetical protein [Anaeromyxobacter oryzae]BDG01169.1 hypothetical protein AMOR_01650 [Anaeromyxobacter oryzae]